jgi:hypothetical protein
MLLEVSAALGAVGGLVQRWFEAKEKREQAERDLKLLIEKNAHDMRMREWDIKVMEVEARNAAALEEVKANKERDVAAYNALAASMAADRASYADRVIEKVGPRMAALLVLVDVVRGLTRPGLAWSGVGALIWLAQWLPASGLSNAAELHGQVVEAVIYVSVTAALWWFAARVPGTLTIGGKKR